MKTMVFCRFRFEAFHCWPDAPEEHSYLKSLHRHEFHVEVRKEVKHSDRDIEFIALKRLAMEAVRSENVLAFTVTWSCEQWAQFLLMKLNACYVEVSEDGENGAIVTG